jgi:hypothetical protein
MTPADGDPVSKAGLALPPPAVPLPMRLRNTAGIGRGYRETWPFGRLTVTAQVIQISMTFRRGDRVERSEIDAVEYHRQGTGCKIWLVRPGAWQSDVWIFVSSIGELAKIEALGWPVRERPRTPRWFNRRLGSR